MKLYIILLILVLYQSTTESCESRITDEIVNVTPQKYHNPYFLKNRTGIVSLFEWKFLDIAKECEDFLGPNNYAAVQVSPVAEHIILEDRPWYERYQPVSYEIHTRSGNISEFYEMTGRCRAVGIRIYVDVVLNHMTSNSERNCTGGSVIDSYNFSYPTVPYNKNDFNQPTCEITDDNDNDPNYVRNCELLESHDLNQKLENVRWSIILFLNRLIALGATGFYVDSAKYMWPEDLKYIYEHINDLPTEYGFQPNSRPFIYQEVHGDWKFDYMNLGAVTEENYPDIMAKIFRNKITISDLNEIGSKSMSMLPNDSALIYIDNHDLQRTNDLTLTYKDSKLIKAAYAFALAHNYGILRIMSSYNFNDILDGPPADQQFNILSPVFDQNEQCSNNIWICEHRWLAIRNMIEFRNLLEIGGDPVKEWQNYGNGTISFCRGNVAFILINNGIDDFAGEIKTCLPQGVYCNVMVSKFDNNGLCTSNWKITIDSDGKTNISIGHNSEEYAIALHINAKEI